MSHPKTLYVAPLKDFSGYANGARNFVRALDKCGMNLVTRDLRYDGGDYERNSRENILAQRSVRDTKIIIQQTTPNEAEYVDGLFNVLSFCWETDLVPGPWIENMNKFQLVLVPCEANLHAARKAGCLVPIKKLEFACDTEKYQKPLKPFILPGVDGCFKFLALCQFSKKKGFDPLLKAYFAEFTPEDNVVLVIKTYININDQDAQRKQILDLIAGMRGLMRLKEYPRIYLIHNVMSDDEIARLHTTSDCFVLPSRGEGWSIPHFDSLGYGKPAIATNWGGPTEFINQDCGWLVDYHMSPVVDMPHPYDYMYTAKENWAEPHVNHLRACMRQAYTLWSRRDELPRWNSMCEAASARVNDFNYDIVGPKYMDLIYSHYAMWKDTQCS